MTKYVIDTSVVLKWISSEKEAEVPESLQIYKLLKEGKIAIFAPSFLLVELVNILYWKQKFTTEELQSFIERIAGSGINFVDDLKENVGDILDLVLKNKITAYDAIFLREAQAQGCRLISADEVLLKLKEMVVSPSQIAN